jgi:signal transduction histidine kinase
MTSLTLHEVLARALRTAADSYVSVLLNRVHQAQVEERRRISRELHDQIGNGVAVAQRDLELYEIHRLSDPDRAVARVERARRGLTETMEAVRQAISDLRLVEPLESLEKALRLFLEESADPDLIRHVEVNGDEAWAPTETIEETFLIVREALRNTIAHADARQILVRIDISPDELRASVVDDGQGFDPTRTRSGGTGLLSMRERAALLNGTLALSSVPGRGTHVALRVPLGTGGA